jgi:NAD(P)-dependent dehydrogenase (short-subunit alcohol dehydrogenase family)
MVRSVFAALKEALMPTVMITGTNRGLGFEFAKQYAADGWRVFAACRHPNSADSLRLLAERSKGLVEVVTMDVTDVQSVKQAAAQVGDGAVDVLINSAGIAGKPHQKAGNVDYESWAAVFNVNTMGPLRVTETFIDHLSRSGRKFAVTITSGMGSLTGNTSGGSIAYRSSKAAVNMVMRSAAIDFAPRGVACVLVNPGWVKTDMGGPGASLTPAESVAALKSLIETLGPAQSGKFFDYDGREHAW